MPELDYDNPTLLTLSYFTRLLFSELDREEIVHKALDGLADFSGTLEMGLFFHNPMTHEMDAVGVMTEKGCVEKKMSVPMDDFPVKELIAKKIPLDLPLDPDRGLPWPLPSDDPGGPRCMCLPLIACNNEVVGMVTMRRTEGTPLEHVMTIPLRIVLAQIAVVLETERLFRMAVYDGLTGLYVRRFFLSRLAEELALRQRYGGEISLLMSDIDHFKKVNDVHGHQQGDVVLAETARIIKEVCRKGVDIAARYGGEEFIALLPNTNRAGARRTAERIRETVEQHAFPGQTAPLKITISLGAATVPEDAEIDAETEAAVEAAANKFPVLPWMGR